MAGSLPPMDPTALAVLTVDGYVQHNGATVRRVFCAVTGARRRPRRRNADRFRLLRPHHRWGRPVWALVCDRACARDLPFQPRRGRRPGSAADRTRTGPDGYKHYAPELVAEEILFRRRAEDLSISSHLRSQI